MKKLLAWLLLITLLLGMWGCDSSAVPPETTLTQTEATAAETAGTEATEAAQETNAAVLEGSLFLKVSSVTFSLVGETDDIYLGVIPRELVAWESDDPSIVSVENGVLTATGVGTTTIRASYADRQVECTAGCLAQTEEELASLDSAVLASPKRLPPYVDLEEPCTYFDNSAIVGDSITYIMFQHESMNNYLGDIVFLARGGVSMNGFVRRFRNMFFRGQEMHLEDAVALAQVDRVYFLMGSNDVADENQRSYVFENWDIMLERIREQVPDVEFVLMSNTPEYDFGHVKDKKNDLIEEYNVQLKQYAADNGLMYLDLAYYVQDHYDRMPKIYSMDPYHFNETGCVNWMQILRYYAQFESEGGTLS